MRFKDGSMQSTLAEKETLCRKPDDFSLEFMSRIALFLLLLVVVIFVGFKIKEGLGAVIAVFIYAFFLLYINGTLWDLFRYFT